MKKKKMNRPDSIRRPVGGRQVKVKIEDMDEEVWKEIRLLAKAQRKSVLGFIKCEIMKHIFVERDKLRAAITAEDPAVDPALAAIIKPLDRG